MANHNQLELSARLAQWRVLAVHWFEHDALLFEPVVVCQGCIRSPLALAD